MGKGAVPKRLEHSTSHQVVWPKKKKKSTEIPIAVSGDRAIYPSTLNAATLLDTAVNVQEIKRLGNRLKAPLRMHTAQVRLREMP